MTSSPSSSSMCHHTRLIRSEHCFLAISASYFLLNQSMDPLRRAVEGTSSTIDVVCRLLAPQSQQSLVESPLRSIFAPNLLTPLRSLFCLVQVRRDRHTPCPLFECAPSRGGGCSRLSTPCLLPMFHRLLWRDRGH